MIQQTETDMKLITLNSTEVYNKNQTSKYWRNIECAPQSAELQSWSTNHPYFVLQGTIKESHDPKEIGMVTDVHIQTYSFWLNPLIADGKYSVHEIN